MPLLKLQLSSVSINESEKRSILSAVSKIVSDSLGKAESYVMVTLENSDILMSAKDGPAAFADIRSIGAINKKNNSQLIKKLCVLLEEKCQIPSERVYCNFTDVKNENWGWNGQTF